MRHTHNRRLAAKHAVHEVEILDASDRLGLAADRAITFYWDALLDVISEDHGPNYNRQRAQLILDQIPDAISTTLRAGLSSLYVHAHDFATRAVVDVLPLPVLRQLSPVSVLEDEPGQPSPGLVQITPRHGVEPVATMPSTAEEKEAIRRLMFPAPGVGKILQALGLHVQPAGWQDMGANVRKLPVDLAATIARLISEGKNQQQVAKEILPYFEGSRMRARRVARTFGLLVSHEGRRAAHDQLGDMLVGYQIHATHDENTRKHHAARDGTIYYKNPEPGQKGFDEMPRPPLEADGSIAWNCLLPGNEVQGTFCAASKAHYTGKAIEITTNLGRVIRVTPNHPVLTTQGFVAAGKIHEGQELLSYMGDIKSPTEHENKGPSLVEDVFRAFSNLPRVVSARPSIFDFHGDERAIDGEVEIVFAERELLEGINTGSAKGEGKSVLGGLRVEATQEPSLRPRSFNAFGVLAAAPSDVSSGNLASAPPAGHSLPLQTLCFGAASELDASRFQDSIQPRSGLSSSARIPTTDAEFIGKLLHRFPSLVSADHVVQVREFNFSGHVFDLMSPYGWIVSNGIILSNCRCWTTPVLRPLDSIVQSPEKQAVFVNAQDKLIPDPVEYSAWFDRADEDKRAKAIGVKRYFFAKDFLQREPKYADFINPEDGKLLTVDQLQKETGVDWVYRRQAADALIAKRQEQIRQVYTFGFEWPKDSGPGPIKPPAPPPPPVPIPPAPKPKATPTPTVIPSHLPIAEKLQAYTAGEQKVQRLAKVGQSVERLQVRASELALQMASMEKTPPAAPDALAQHEEKLIRLADRHAVALERHLAARKKAAAIAHNRIKVKEPATLTVKVGKSPGIKKSVTAALEFLEKVTQAHEGEKPLVAKTRKIQSRAKHHYEHGISTIHLADSDGARTAVHELGHAIEVQMPGALAAARDFLAHRVKGQTLKQLKKLFPKRGFRLGEFGRDDDFGRFWGPGSVEAWYVGKSYGHQATEIISMGLEALYIDPVGFATKDPEYCKFILGILDGSLRR